MVAVQSTANQSADVAGSFALRHNIDAARRRPPHARRARCSASTCAAAAMRRAQPNPIRDRNGTRRPEAPQGRVQTETVLRAELPPRPKLRGKSSASRISEVRGSAAVSRHLHESSPGEKAGGGLFSDFEAVRTATVPSAHRRELLMLYNVIRSEASVSWNWVLVWAR